LTIGIPTAIDAQIEAAIQSSSSQGLAALAAPGRSPVEASYIIKYTNPRYGGKYPPATNALVSPSLYVSPSPGFTWGAALYVCPVAYPLSGGIYGRCGVVAQLGPTNSWRLFNATDPAVAGLYVQWIQRQPMFSMLTLSTHSQLANQVLRNAFRRRFRIDAVVFPPDELNSHYVRRQHDKWLAISEWLPSGRLATFGPTTRTLSPKLCVILAEEFEPTKSGIGRQAFIGPTPFLAAMKPTPADIIKAYQKSNLLWVGA
jgi:hypothetical protein